ncbi:cell division initiation protein [Desulfitispora alkaliphila]|uniref:DivIVA domain-containing protein n=1 Tax=Desulfitispora alkaliphila TaxID=622674 RepID=UPI003D253C20
MTLTPLDIQNKSFKKGFRGYNEDEVDAFLDKIIENYEQLYKENMDLKDEVEKCKNEVNKYEKLEDTLHNSLIVAQQTAEEVKKNADERSNLILREAESKAESMIYDANKKVDEIYKQYNELLEKVKLFKIKYKSFLQAQIDSIDEDIAMERESNNK